MAESRSPQETTADASLLPLNWSEFLDSQQRWWSEWLEAGQIWSSWWFTQMPTFNWPPVGELTPPHRPDGSADLATPPAPRSQRVEAAKPPRHIEPAAQTPRPSRARSARHH